MKILLTGATGFIGSNIAKQLLESGYNVFATHRTTSSFEKCSPFKNNIHWINTDIPDWKEQIKDSQSNQLIHTAWGGIEAGDRNNWELQIRNFLLTKEYFDLAKECGIKKVISLGSQAEYGRYDFPVNELTIPKPEDAYGAVKYLCANYLRNIFENTDIQWYWIRIFSVFGENENSDWLIPTVISKLLKNKPIPLTACEQLYNYLYIKDFIKQLITVIECKNNKAGIYNLCNYKSIKLKDLLIQITEILNVSKDLLKFGTIPYRKGQNMIIEGNNSKLIETFNIKDDSYINLSQGLAKTISFYKNM